MRNLRFSTLLITLSFGCSSLMGQYSNFDLGQYKLPEIKTSRLDLNFNLNTVRNNSRSDADPDLHNKSTSDYFTGMLHLNYFYFRNSSKYQGNLSADADFKPDLSTSKYSGLANHSNNYDVFAGIFSTNRFFNQANSFIEIDPTINFNSQNKNAHQEFTDLSPDDYKFNQEGTTISIPVSIGHGRIEPVEDARLAIYILEELNKAGRISKIPEDNIVINMAREISKIKNKRFFDSRIMKMKELEVVDSFLVANNLISTHDIRYFAVLNDQWDYAEGPSRLAGFAINAGLNNSISFNRMKENRSMSDSTQYIYKASHNNYVVGGFVRIRYAKPVNLYWQNSLIFESSLNRSFMKDAMANNNTLTTTSWESGFKYSWQFLPDSRTSASLSLTGSFNYSFSDQNNTKSRTTSFSVSPSFNAYYYLSPQLRLQINSSFLSNYSHSSSTMEYVVSTFKNVSKMNGLNLSLTLLYSFF